MNDPSLSEDKFLNVHASFMEYRQVLNKSTNTLNTRIKKFRLDQLIKEQDFQPYLFPVTQTRGFHLWVDIVDDPESATFLQHFEDAMHVACENMQLGIERKKTLPVVIVDIIMDQCKDRQKLFPVTQSVYHKFQEFLRYQYRPLARKSLGLWDVTHSDTEYEHWINVETTLTYSAREVYALGLKHISFTVDKIRSTVDCGLHGGRHGGLPPLNPGTIHTQEELLEHMSTPGQYAFIQPLTGNTFSIQNYGELTTKNVEVPVDVIAILNRYGPQATYVGPTPGHNCGRVYANLIEPHSNQSTCNLLAHEIIPGHHLEVCNNLSQWGQSDLWYFTNFTSYIEGWALYSEEMMATSNTSTQGQLAFLYSELLRDVRLVVDAGIHSHWCGKWTLKDAATFMKTGKFRGKFLVAGYTGLPTLTAHQIESEILRYSTRPAYATAYKIGKLYFTQYAQMALARGLTQQEVNDKFLARRVPLSMMQELFPLEYPPPLPLTTPPVPESTKERTKEKAEEPTDDSQDDSLDNFYRIVSSNFSSTHRDLFMHQYMQCSGH